MYCRIAGCPSCAIYRSSLHSIEIAQVPRTSPKYYEAGENSLQGWVTVPIHSTPELFLGCGYRDYYVILCVEHVAEGNNSWLNGGVL